MNRRALWMIGGGCLAGSLLAAQLPPPAITRLTVHGPEKILEWSLYPAVDQYEVLGTTRLDEPLQPDPTGVVMGNRWMTTNDSVARFWQLQVTPVSSNRLWTANLLNRVAYGLTPDAWERVEIMGPEAYLEEQLAPETVAENLDEVTLVLTNGVVLDASTNWVSLTVTGRISSSSLYMYLREPGDLYLDDLQFRVLETLDQGSNLVTVLGPNVLVNGDFEEPLESGWTLSANHAASVIRSGLAASGQRSLHLVASAGGTTRESSVYQDIVPELPVGSQSYGVLSFKYLPSPMAPRLTIRLSGSGTIISGMPEPDPPKWIYATATGTATSTPRLYLYLSGAGEAWVDHLKLVAGTDPDGGPNLLQNGDFESALSGPWVLTSNFTNSFIDPEVSREGQGSLRVVATAAGSGSGNSVYQTVPGLVSGQTYTLSYWYRPATRGRTVTVRLSGSRLVSRPDTSLAGIRRRLDDGEAELEDLRAWYVRQAVGSERQLLQVLLQFSENHFVTQHAKSRDYLDRYFNDTAARDRIATQWEYREISRWRDRLMRPDCTFYDLLKVSAESPAMIVYMDTVDSRGDGNNVANENYARELLELFACGVDNGYDQNDIVAMSRAWTGWSVDVLDRPNADNPLAPRSTTYGAYPGSGYGGTSNLVGVWTFRFKDNYHGTNRASVFSLWDPESPGDNPVAVGPKVVPARFGPPWAGLPYQLTLPARTGTNGIADGYDVIAHLANLPFTMEYLSVKLCRLLVHDDFDHGVYDYTDPDRSEEAELVRQCMLAWWEAQPRGQLRPVLRTIFASDLFRSHGGSLQKIKTPLEYSVSALRALRSRNSDGTFTADTDGYDLVGTDRTASSAPLTRMGGMLLFDRGDPDGYPETGPAWISAGTLAERIRFVQSLCIKPGDPGHAGSQSGLGNDAGADTYVDPVGLLQRKLPVDSWNDAGAVAAYFLSLLYPAEGLGNLNQYQHAAVAFLNTADDGMTSSDFALLSDTSSDYDRRVRGMVAMLMSFPRFQEQ